MYLDKSLFDHIVEGWGDLVDRNCRVPHPQDPVELGGHERHPRLRHRLCERLVSNLYAWTIYRLNLASQSRQLQIYKKGGKKCMHYFYDCEKPKYFTKKPGKKFVVFDFRLWEEGCS